MRLSTCPATGFSLLSRSIKRCEAVLCSHCEHIRGGSLISLILLLRDSLALIDGIAFLCKEIPPR